jgi:hypothetical protein
MINPTPDASGFRYYGADAGLDRNVFVATGATLQMDGGAILRAQTFKMDAGATLHITGNSRIQVPDKTNISLTDAGTVTLHFALTKTDAGSGIAKLYLEDPSRTPFSGGVKISNPDEKKLNIVIDYTPAQSGVGKQITLLSGIEEFAGVISVGDATEQYLTSPYAKWNDIEKVWEIEIRKSPFTLYFDSQGHLILEQTGYVPIPEPSTYALSAAALLSTLLLLKRRRRRKESTPHP